MSELSDALVDYLVKYHDRLTERHILIQLMTQVRSRPELLVPELGWRPSASKPTVSFNWREPSPGKFQPPPSAAAVKGKELPPDLAFMVKEQVMLMRPSETTAELLSSYWNWLQQSEAQQQKADAWLQQDCQHDNLEFFDQRLRELQNSPDRHFGLWPGDIVRVIDPQDQEVLAYVDAFTDEEMTLCYLTTDNGQRLVSEVDQFTLPGKVLRNASDPVKTTVGRFLLNKLLLDLPFGDKIPYVNETIDVGDLDGTVSKLLMGDKITTDQVKMYFDNGFFIGNFAELCVPGYSKKSLTTDPNIAKRRDELYQEHAHELDDPVVVSKIEDELIAMDQEYLKGDVAMRFYKPMNPGKVFGVARKKLYLSVGGIEAFSNVAGQIDVIPQSLQEGFNEDTFTSFVNEIRKGSFQRGHETRKGGAQTKFIIRIFQDLVIDIEDCGTTKGMIFDFDKYSYKDFIGRYVWIKGKWTLVTEDNCKTLPGGEQRVRSPMYCKYAGGICRLCAGEVLRDLRAKQPAMMIVDISSTFMMAAMKNMHGSKLSLCELSDLNKLVL